MLPRGVWRTGVLTPPAPPRGDPAEHARLALEERAGVSAFLLRQRYLSLAGAWIKPLASAARRFEARFLRLVLEVWVDFDAAADKCDSDRECL